jgi:hypothetical protein
MLKSARGVSLLEKFKPVCVLSKASNKTDLDSAFLLLQDKINIATPINIIKNLFRYNLISLIFKMLALLRQSILMSPPIADVEDDSTLKRKLYFIITRLRQAQTDKLLIIAFLSI